MVQARTSSRLYRFVPVGFHFFRWYQVVQIGTSVSLGAVSETSINIWQMADITCQYLAVQSKNNFAPYGFVSLG